MNLLVIRACAIGDFVLNLPALEALQNYYGDVSFTLVGYPGTLELARDFINVARIHSIEQEPWCRLFHEPIDGLRFDRAIVWMKDSTVAANLRLSGLTEVLHAEPFPPSGHAAAHLLNTVGLPRPELPERWRPTTNRIMLHPGSGSPRKNWPHFKELAAHLDSAVFLLGPAESDPVAGGFRRLENLPLRDVAQALMGSRLYVGNDSGITHLSAYLGVPTIALFGVTDPHVWGPLGRRVRVLVNASVSRVLAEIEILKSAEL